MEMSWEDWPKDADRESILLIVRKDKEILLEYAVSF